MKKAHYYRKGNIRFQFFYTVIGLQIKYSSANSPNGFACDFEISLKGPFKCEITALRT